MRTNATSKRPAVWQRLIGLALAAVFLVLAYRNAASDPETWRWAFFGAGLGRVGAVGGALIAVAVIVHRDRSAAGRHVHN